MDNFINNIVSITILLFLLITFLQSGIDKIIDWKGNLSWLKEHFASTFMGNMVPLLLTIVLIIEMITAVCCVFGIYYLITDDITCYAVLAMFLACITLLMLLFGQSSKRLSRGLNNHLLLCSGHLWVICSFFIKHFIVLKHIN
ncbi:DoxX family protein [Aquimarina sp. AU58]|uniref:DoxX family protein n=1 Tax=Aquimarina sp. AU58 TaxID=1874112 RepID=UPI00351A664D